MEHPICDDGLLIPEIGRWGKAKYHFLRRYLELFSTGMKNHWSKRYYIDLFAAAGIARVRGTSELVATSAIVAAQVKDRFSRLVLCEKDPERAEALAKRLENFPQPQEPIVVCGDANDRVHELVSHVPVNRSLAVTFADPFGLHLDFEAIRAVAERRSDLIVLLPDRMDALRNWATYYLDNPESNLDRFMGESGWRDVLAEATTNMAAQRLRDRYIERLQTLGYEHFGYERIKNNHGAEIYVLVFASKHRRGLDFWEKAKSVDEGGQRTFDF